VRLQRPPSGLMLIELLAACAISLLLLGGLLTIYLNSVRVSALQAALYEAQDQARSAIDILNSDIHRAGQIGCAKLTADFSLLAYPPYSITPRNKLFSQNEHEITVRYADYPPAVLLETMNNPALLYVSKNKNFKPGEIAIIADCSHAELFKIAAVHSLHNSWRIVPEVPLHELYAVNAEVSRLVVNRYFVAATRHGSMALYAQDVTGRHMELVEGIKKMKIYYSIEQGGKVNDVAVSEVGDWSKVVGVGIDLEVEHASIKKTWHSYAAL
jgi:type IV pilus assembly protein PilW